MAMTSEEAKRRGSLGGKATGPTKRRGDSEYYRQLRLKGAKVNSIISEFNHATAHFAADKPQPMQTDLKAIKSKLVELDERFGGAVL